MRLLHAGLAAAEDRLPDLDRLRVLAPVGPEPALGVGLAGAAVAHGVAVGGTPPGDGPFGPLAVAGGVGEVELGLAHGAFAVPGDPVAPFHVVEPAGDRLDGDLGGFDDPAGHPLEAPEQGVGVAAVEARGVAVVLLEEAGERDDHAGAFGAVLVGVDLGDQRVAEQRGVPADLGGRGEGLGLRVAGRTVGQAAVLLQSLPDLFVGHGGHLPSSWAGMEWVAHSRSPRKARLSRVESAGRRGRWDISRACP